VSDLPKKFRRAHLRSIVRHVTRIDYSLPLVAFWWRMLHTTGQQSVVYHTVVSETAQLMVPSIEEET
jgi:hypothetical protein